MREIKIKPYQVLELNQRPNVINQFMMNLSVWHTRKKHLIDRYYAHDIYWKRQCLRIESASPDTDVIVSAVNKIKLLNELFLDEMLQENAISLNMTTSDKVNNHEDVDLVFLGDDFVLEQELKATVNNERWAIANVPLSDKYDVTLLFSKKERLVQIGEIICLNSNNYQAEELNINEDYIFGAIAPVHHNIYEANSTSHIMFPRSDKYKTHRNSNHFAIVGIRFLD